MNENMLDPICVGRVLAEIRIKKGLSQEVVSGFAGIGRTHLSAIECGVRKPTLETFFRVCFALEESPSKVMAIIEEETK